MFAIGSAVLVALLPVFQSTRTSPQDALKSDGRGATAGRVPLRLRHSLIVAEIALSVMLLVGAGLFVRSFARLQNVEPGFDPRQRADDAHHRADGEVSRRRRSTTSSSSSSIDSNRRLACARASVASQFPPQGVFSTTFRLDSMATTGETMPMSQITAASATHFVNARGAARRRARPSRLRIAATPHSSRSSTRHSSRSSCPGQDALGRRVSTRAIRSAVAAHGDRRHRRRHAEPRHAERAIAGDLRAPAPADLEQSAVPAGAVRRRRRGDVAGGATAARLDRSGTAGLRHPDAGRGGGSGEFPESVLDGPVRDLCRGRAVADHDRHLRRDVVCGDGADPGNRRAPRGWRRPPRCDVAGAGASAGVDRHRAGHRPGRRGGRERRDSTRALRSAAARSRHDWRGRRPSWAAWRSSPAGSRRGGPAVSIRSTHCATSSGPRPPAGSVAGPYFTRASAHTFICR